MHQVTTMLATSKNVLFPGHYNHLLTTALKTLHFIVRVLAQAIIKVSGHPYRWLADCYDLEIEHF